MKGTLSHYSVEKVLIGYDGSECARSALLDLLRSGLPESVDAVVISVADVILPEADSDDETLPLYVPQSVRLAHEQKKKVVAEAKVLAEEAAAQLVKLFPSWTVRSENYADSPAWAIIKKADEWKPDLVVVGSQGRSAIGRLVFGSVSQRVLYEARCSVRIARGKALSGDEPIRIVLGFDGSPDSETAVEAVAARSWPSGTEARLIAVLDNVMDVGPSKNGVRSKRWVRVAEDEDREWATAKLDEVAGRLRSGGLLVSTTMTGGRPTRVIIDHAADWNADSIFLGARGVRGVDRLLLGSVSSAVAAGAHCSVEVVRSA